jgi:hypothetical protein
MSLLSYCNNSPEQTPIRAWSFGKARVMLLAVAALLSPDVDCLRFHTV